MSRDSRFLRRTYNTVITASVTSRSQMMVPLDTSYFSDEQPSPMDTVAFEMFAHVPRSRHLTKVCFGKVHVPTLSGESEIALVRRAAKAHGGEIGRAWWEFDATCETTALSDVVLEQESRLPSDALTPTYMGLTALPDKDNICTVLYSGDKNA